MTHSGTKPAALLFVLAVLLAVSCSRSTAPTSRKDQEHEFRDLFGFAPPETIAEIRYQDVYVRNLMDDEWQRWICFTYEGAVLSRILKEGGHAALEKGRIAPLEAGPAWWPKVDQMKVPIYTRTSPKGPGYFFREYVWRDPRSDRVCLTRRYSS